MRWLAEVAIQADLVSRGGGQFPGIANVGSRDRFGVFLARTMA
jgi:hypothetical protein